MYVIIGDAPPTDVTAEQTGVSTVLVMWTAPSPPPTDGYQVQIIRGSTTTTVNVAETSYSKSSVEHGVYRFRVSSLTQHFPSEATEPVQVTVKGKYAMLCIYRRASCIMCEISQVTCHHSSPYPHPLPHQSLSPGLSRSSACQ